MYNENCEDSDGCFSSLRSNKPKRNNTLGNYDKNHRWMDKYFHPRSIHDITIDDTTIDNDNQESFEIEEMKGTIHEIASDLKSTLDSMDTRKKLTNIRLSKSVPREIAANVSREENSNCSRIGSPSVSRGTYEIPSKRSVLIISRTSTPSSLRTPISPAVCSSSSIDSSTITHESNQGKPPSRSHGMPIYFKNNQSNSRTPSVCASPSNLLYQTVPDRRKSPSRLYSSSMIPEDSVRPEDVSKHVLLKARARNRSTDRSTHHHPHHYNHVSYNQNRTPPPSVRQLLV